MGNLLAKSKIDNEGRVEIPSEIREAADLFCGEEVSFAYDESKDILTVRPISKICKICENTEGTINVLGNIYICEECQANVVKTAR